MGLFQFEILLGNIYRINILREKYTTQLLKWSINISGEQEHWSILWPTLSGCQRWDAGLVDLCSGPGGCFCVVPLAKLGSECRVSRLAVRHCSALYWGTVVPLRIKKPSSILKTFPLINLPVALFHMFLAKRLDFSVPSFSIPPKTLGLRDRIVSIVHQWWGGCISVCSSKDTSSYKNLFSVFSAIFGAGMALKRCCWQTTILQS